MPDEVPSSCLLAAVERPWQLGIQIHAKSHKLSLVSHRMNSWNSNSICPAPLPQSPSSHHLKLSLHLPVKSYRLSNREARYTHRTGWDREEGLLVHSYVPLPYWYWCQISRPNIATTHSRRVPVPGGKFRFVSLRKYSGRGEVDKNVQAFLVVVSDHTGRKAGSKPTKILSNLSFTCPNPGSYHMYHGSYGISTKRAGQTFTEKNISWCP